MGHPKNSYDALEQLLKTCDKIWNTVGDSSNGFSFYSKRLILAGVYSSTLAHWLSNTSGDLDQTESFLDNRLEDVKNLGKFSKRPLQHLDGVKSKLYEFIGKKI
jgi:ubiquinone biosynthesis protein COQ9